MYISLLFNLPEANPHLPAQEFAIKTNYNTAKVSLKYRSRSAGRQRILSNWIYSGVLDSQQINCRLDEDSLKIFKDCLPSPIRASVVRLKEVQEKKKKTASCEV